MKEAILYNRLRDNRVQCNLCYRGCVIGEGERGYCLSRMNLGGILYSLIYGVISFAQRTRIEEKPFHNFHPGTFCLSVGTFGCNFRCKGCQNHEISWGTKELDALASKAKSSAPESLSALDFSENNFRHIGPEELVEMAKEYKCAGLAFTYNEPTIWAEYVLDTAKMAKEKGLYTVYVTNSWLTPRHLDIIGPYIDAMALDIKSLDDEYYSLFCDVKLAVNRVLQTCTYATKQCGIYVETRTCIIPGVNDDFSMLCKIARWIKNNLGEDSLWHLLRFFPKHQLKDIPPTPEKTLMDTQKLGKEAGLRYVNVIGDKGCD